MVFTTKTCTRLCRCKLLLAEIWACIDQLTACPNTASPQTTSKNQSFCLYGKMRTTQAQSLSLPHTLNSIPQVSEVQAPLVQATLLVKVQQWIYPTSTKRLLPTKKQASLLPNHQLNVHLALRLYVVLQLHSI